jgi:hypothetical protein
MKLYTEEQVRELLNEILVLSYSVEDSINSLTPIELPSDEEIESLPWGSAVDNYHVEGFTGGAKWMRDKLTKTKEK